MTIIIDDSSTLQEKPVGIDLGAFSRKFSNSWNAYSSPQYPHVYAPSQPTLCPIVPGSEIPPCEPSRVVPLPEDGEPSSGKGVAVNVDEELGQELLARSRFILVGDKLAQEVAIG
ncbi:3-oxoadipate enol-lactone hydrolase [Marssonina coronariae]|uniref:3-oxoadipate enol-lactone hydrolase n=1 Tax=Diplocarpon coronariae TaxID=2795749 RepID=A0A218ZGP5_9HELO|nr:3-oxoadipate enol-lactone hydrolase [Marssonina coronariae]